MFFPISNYLALPGTIFSVVKQLRTQQSFIKKNIIPLLAKYKENNDGSLTETDFIKITHYYGLAVPAILGESFCALQGRNMRDQERWASTCQGAMTGLFDDFFDKEYMEDEKVKSKITPGKSENIQQSNEQLFDLFYGNVLNSVPEKMNMQQALLAVHEAQVRSKEQVDPTTPMEKIESVTMEKGGTSLLFYRTAFSPPPAEMESKILYHLGGSMQLANDIFDVYKDREKNIRTLMTETRNVASIRTLLEERLSYGYSEAYKLPFQPRDIKKFLNTLSIGIFSRCFVCLDHLEQIEKFTNNSFNVSAYSRNQLICDMDTKKNMLRSAAYHLKTLK
jgi:hypothetical protein